MSKRARIIADIETELDSALKKFPTWPSDMIHAATVVGEKSGEILKAALEFHYEPHKQVTINEIRAEAIEAAAMAIRFVTSLDNGDYKIKSVEQHEQKD